MRLDQWKREQLEIMYAVGNESANEYFEKNLPSSSKKCNSVSQEQSLEFIQNKYIKRVYSPAGFEDPVKIFIKMQQEPGYENNEFDNLFKQQEKLLMKSKKIIRSEENKANIHSSQDLLTSDEYLGDSHLSSIIDNHDISHSSHSNTDIVTESHIQTNVENPNQSILDKLNELVSEEFQKSVFCKLLEIPENKKCADCDIPNPSWISTGFGVFLCIHCMGKSYSASFLYSRTPSHARCPFNSH